VFVGELGEGEYRTQLLELSESLGENISMSITGWVSDTEYEEYLNRADFCIQLRRNSHGESSAAVLDCLISGKPLMISDTPENTSIPENAVFKINNDHLSSELSRILMDSDSHATRAFNARVFAEHELTLERNALKYLDLLDKSLSDEQYFAKIEERSKKYRSLYLDVSAVFANDLGTGIQRVVKKVLLELLRAQDPEFCIVPVYFDVSHNSFFTAEALMSNLLDWGQQIFEPQEVRPFKGDVFLGLDLAFSDIAYGCLSRWQRSGVQVYFVVYDILPMTHPRFFPQFAVDKFRGWVEMTAQFDGVLAISNHTLSEYLTFFPELPENFASASFPLGSDFQSSKLDEEFPVQGSMTRTDLHFLMVGTIEPRKGHMDALNALRILWQRGYTGRLTVLGGWGWGVENVREELEKEARNNPLLRILNEANDEVLEELYRSSDCLLAVSECEGFGLPIIEAARRGVSILARDIPVFREVAGEGADYLSDSEPWDEQILKWDAAFKSKETTSPEKVLSHSWAESAEILFRKIVEFDSRTMH
jgi:glycosyltransferase involved in cell wall biosynthesis